MQFHTKIAIFSRLNVVPEDLVFSGSGSMFTNNFFHQNSIWSRFDFALI